MHRSDHSSVSFTHYIFLVRAAFVFCCTVVDIAFVRKQKKGGRNEKVYLLWGAAVGTQDLQSFYSVHREFLPLMMIMEQQSERDKYTLRLRWGYD